MAESLFTVLQGTAMAVVGVALVMIIGFLISMVAAGYESYKHRITTVPHDRHGAGPASHPPYAG